MGGGLRENSVSTGLGPVPPPPPYLQACGRLGVDLKSNPFEGGEERMGHLCDRDRRRMEASPFYSRGKWLLL